MEGKAKAEVEPQAVVEVPQVRFFVTSTLCLCCLPRSAMSCPSDTRALLLRSQFLQEEEEAEAEVKPQREAVGEEKLQVIFSISIDL